MNLERILKKADGRPRKSVLVIFWSESEDKKATVRTTDKNGRFVIEDVDIDFPTGTYSLRYYGDGILPTKWNESKTMKIQEDPITPWEYDIQIYNIGSEFDTTPPDNSVLSDILTEG